MTEIEDVLTGDKTVLVKTKRGDSFEFDKDGDKIEANRVDIPDEVIDAVETRGFEIDSNFPKTVEIYAHDDPTPHKRREIARDLGVEENSDLADTIAGLTYEIELTVNAYEDGSFEVTHVFGKELVEPYSY